MKLPIKGDIAGKLARAEEDLAATEQTIATAQSERLAKLLDAPADEIEAIDRRIVDQHRVAAVYREQITALQARFADEQTAERLRKYKASIDKIASALPGLSKAAQELESALLGIPRALLKFQAEQRAALQSYPDNVERPFRSELGMERIERVLVECFAPFSPEWPSKAREHWSLERKLENLKEVISDFAKAESAGYEAMLLRLREQAPKSDEREIAA